MTFFKKLFSKKKPACVQPAQGKYDVAAYVWPAYTGKEPRSLIFWPEGEGEWQTVRAATPKFEGHMQPRVPQLGYKDEADKKTMEEQIELATSHGVNVFIYDWYWYDGRPFLECCLDGGFLKAKNRDKMKFYLMWANHDANYTWDKRLAEKQDTPVWLGSVDRRQFDIITDRVIEKYFSQSNYYKIAGAPVFCIYDVANLIKGLGGVDKTIQALRAFREKTVKAGFPALHLQVILMGNIVNLSGVDEGLKLSSDIIKKLEFDSATNYQFAHFVNINRDYNAIISDVKRHWKKFSEMDLTYYPHVSVGWDNNPRFSSFRRGVMKNNTPQNVEKAFLAAREEAERLGVSLITVNSWNEWTESSYLLPDDLYGTGYLDAIKKVFSE